MALDRQGIVDAAAKGYGEVTDARSPPSPSGWGERLRARVRVRGPRGVSHDLEEAKRLVEEAGAVGEEITYVTAPIGSDFNVIAQATAAAAESIGLKATIETVTPNAYTALFSDPSAREGVDLFYTSGTCRAPTRSRCTACCAPASSATTADGATPSSTRS